MKNLKVACDVEGTLADIHSLWLLKLYFKEGLDIPLEKIDWDFSNLEGHLEKPLQKFLKDTQDIWKYKPDLIQFTEKNLEEEIKTLYTINPFDLVTSRNEIGGIKKWCDLHNIPYKEIIFVRQIEDKSNYDYDIFIDDSPRLADSIERSNRGTLLLYDRPWNREVDESSRVKRVKSFEEVNAIIAQHKFGNLIDKAIEVRKFSKSFNIKVGASLLLKDGTIYTGTNTEHMIHKGTHAEVSALLKALEKDGYKGEDAIAMVTVFYAEGHPNYFPCAECRQYLWEDTNPDLLLIAANTDGRVYKVKRLSQLYPYPYPSKSYR